MIPATSIAEPQSATLVIIDIQERLAAAMESRDRVNARAGLLLSAAAIAGVPVVVTRQYPKGLGDLDPAVAADVDSAASAGVTVTLVDKLTFDCFGEPQFTQAVCGSGRSQLLIAGMESHICVTQTALTGLREGFDVHVVADACCSRDAEAHAVALTRMAHAGAVITTAESVAYELVGRAGTPEFKALLAAVKG